LDLDELYSEKRNMTGANNNFANMGSPNQMFYNNQPNQFGDNFQNIYNTKNNMINYNQNYNINLTDLRGNQDYQFAQLEKAMQNQQNLKEQQPEKKGKRPF